MAESSLPKTHHHTATQDKISVTRFPRQNNQLLLAHRSQQMINERRRRGFKIMATKKRFLEQHPGVQLQSLPPQHKLQFQQVSLQQPHHGSPKWGTFALRRPETGASPNQIASSLEPTPRTFPVAPKDPTPSSLIEPEPENVEPRGMAQSPWLPAAAGAAVASSAQSYDGDEAFQNESALASEQSVTASGQTHEQSSQPPEAAPQTTNPFSPLLAAIQKPFSAFSPEPQTQEEGTDGQEASPGYVCKSGTNQRGSGRNSTPKNNATRP